MGIPEAVLGKREAGAKEVRTVPASGDLGPALAMTPGTVLADRYRVERLMGEGGLGAVYQVEHVHMRKTFALKVLHGGVSGNPEVTARFEREAIAASHIEHPNVAAATDFGRLPDGTFFLVLEYIAGRTLRDELKAVGPLPLDRALKILRGIVAGVASAHARGIVHRDLKPENIMLVDKAGDPDFVKLLDFGIARIEAIGPVGREAAVEALTVSGVMMGTPDYMSPEQILGQSVDARSDLYSLGVVLFELLTGACPFRGDSAMSVLRQHLVDPPEVGAKGAALPSRVIDVVLRLLAKNRNDRFQSAGELAQAIDALLVDAAHARAAAVGARNGTIDDAKGTIVLARWIRLLRDAGARMGKLRVFAADNHRRRVVIGSAAALAVVMTVWLAWPSKDEPTARPNAATREAPPAAPRKVAEPALRSTPSPAPSSTANPSPTPTAILSSVPEAPGDVRRAAEPPARSNAAASTRKPEPKPAPARRTGPGGIYIPPPKDWFK